MGGRGAVLGHGDFSTFESFCPHTPVHPPPPPLQHLPWDQARDRWSLGAVRHKQSGYQILASTAAAQLVLRIHSHLTATPATDPYSHISHIEVCTHTDKTHTHAQTITYYKLLHSNTLALTLHLIMHSI